MTSTMNTKERDPQTSLRDGCSAVAYRGLEVHGYRHCIATRCPLGLSFTRPQLHTTSASHDLSFSRPLFHGTSFSQAMKNGAIDRRFTARPMADFTRLSQKTPYPCNYTIYGSGLTNGEALLASLTYPRSRVPKVESPKDFPWRMIVPICHE
jgi:hypothetical protein